MNADGIIGANGGIQGYNMFAYCNNMPVMASDPSGQGWFDDVADWTNENIFQPVKTFVENVIDDFRNFDFDNKDEQIVLKSNYFSWYKDYLVIRTPFKRSGTFGILFIKETETADGVKHERGHDTQLEALGWFNYLFAVAIPSVFKLGKEDYYDKPWEITADYLGGVERNYPTDKLQAGFDWLNMFMQDGRHFSSSGRVHGGGGPF